MHTHSKYIFVNLTMRIILSILFLSVCYPDSDNVCDSPSEEDFLSRDAGCSDYAADSFLFYVCESINNKIIQKEGYDGIPSYSHSYVVPDTTHLMHGKSTFQIWIYPIC